MKRPAHGEPVTLITDDPTGVIRLPGLVTADHGPDYEYRYLVVCAGYELFPSGRIFRSPGGMYVTWASAAMIERVVEEAA